MPLDCACKVDINDISLTELNVSSDQTNMEALLGCGYKVNPACQAPCDGTSPVVLWSVGKITKDPPQAPDPEIEKPNNDIRTCTVKYGRDAKFKFTVTVSVTVHCLKKLKECTFKDRNTGKDVTVSLYERASGETVVSKSMDFSTTPT